MHIARSMLLCAVMSSLFVFSGDRLQAQTTISAFPTSLNFVFQIGGATPAVQNIEVTGTPGQTVNVSVTTTTGSGWLGVSVLSGVTPFTVPAFVSPGSLAAGNYTGNIILTAAGASNSPMSIPVGLVVSGGPLMSVSPGSLRYSFVSGGPIPSAQTLSLMPTSGTLSYSAAASVSTPVGGTWLSVAPTSGSVTNPIPAPLQVSVNPTGLAPGTYAGAITIAAPAAGNPSVVIPVQLTVDQAANLTVAPGSLAFTFQAGGPSPSPRSLTIGVTAGPSVNWTASSSVTTPSGGSWLSIGSSAGTTPANLTVSVSPGGLAAGTYSGSVTITAAGVGGSPVTIPVTLTVATDPVLQASPAAVNFQFQAGGTNPPPQMVVISNFGPSLALGVSVSSAPWLTATPASGASPTAILLSVDPGTLSPGTYNANVQVTGTGATNSPLTIPVTLQITNTAVLRVSRSNVTIFGQPGGSSALSQTVTVSSTGQALGFNTAVNTTSGGNWLSASPSSGTSGSDITITANPSSLAAGTYSGTVTVSQTDLGGGSPQVINVTLILDPAAALDVNTAPLTFTAVAGGPQPPNQSINVISTGAAFNYSATAITTTGGQWLIAAPSAALTGTPVTVGVNATGLAPGTYTGVVAIAAPGVTNSPIYVPVRIIVTASQSLAASPTVLVFNAVAGAPNPTGQVLRVTASLGALSFNVTPSTSSGGNWLTATPTGGVTPQDVVVTTNVAGLMPGTYGGSITIVSAGATNTPLIVPVTLVVTRQPVPLTVSPASLTFNFQTGGATPAAQSIALSASNNIAFTAAASTGGTGTWLLVSPGTGSTPSNLSVSVNPAGLTAGTYNGEVTITSAEATNSPVRIPVTLTVTTIVAGNLTVVRHSASFAPVGAVPGLIVTLGGSNLGPQQGVSFSLGADGRVPTTLADVRVLFDGVPAPLLFVRQDQINCIVPYEVSGRFSSRVEVEYRGVRSNSIELRVTESAPGIFTLTQTGSGAGAVLNQDFSVNGSTNPAERGSVIQIYATGEGQTNPTGVNGFVPRTIGDLRRPLLPVVVRIGGIQATVEYAGSAPGLVSGALQVNARVPEGVTPGSAVSIEIIIGGVSSQAGVTIAVR
jgi:uncharacterized protein (TIGR03437 family)